MPRNNAEIMKIKEELALAYEAQFGVNAVDLAKELANELKTILSDIKSNFIRKKIGHLYETGRGDYIDFINLLKIIFNEEMPKTLNAPPKEEKTLSNGIVKRRGLEVPVRSRN